VSSKDHLLIPATLDLPNIILKLGLATGKVTVDGMASVCHNLLITLSYQSKKSEKCGGYQKLSAARLQRFDRNYNVCIRELINFNVIQTDNEYKPGEECKGFKFTNFYMGRGLKPHLLSDKKISRAYHKYWTDEQTQPRLVPAGYSHLTKWYQKGYLEIDEEKAIDWIKTSLNEGISALQEQHKKNINERILDLRHKHDMYRFGIYRILYKDYRLSIDQTGHRFHSPLTGLKKQLRNMLTYAGKELISLDIKNSQPFFSSLLLEKSFYDKVDIAGRLTLGKLNPELYLQLKNNGSLKAIRGILSEDTVTRYKNVDIQKYREFVHQGCLYEQLMDWSLEKTGMPLTRDQAKDSIFLILFDNPRTTWRTAEYRMFNSQFPTVLQIFELIKSFEYNQLAILLQRIESEIILRKVTAKFSRTCRTAPILTIHDSVATHADYLPQLKAIMTEQIEFYVGAVPMLMTDDWRPQQIETNNVVVY